MLARLAPGPVSLSCRSWHPVSAILSPVAGHSPLRRTSRPHCAGNASAHRLAVRWPISPCRDRATRRLPKQPDAVHPSDQSDEWAWPAEMRLPCVASFHSLSCLVVEIKSTPVLLPVSKGQHALWHAAMLPMHLAVFVFVLPAWMWGRCESARRTSYSNSSSEGSIAGLRCSAGEQAPRPLNQVRSRHDDRYRRRTACALPGGARTDSAGSSGGGGSACAKEPVRKAAGQSRWTASAPYSYRVASQASEKRFRPM